VIVAKQTKTTKEEVKMDKNQNKLYAAHKRICEADAELKYHLVIFGDFLATREGYKKHTKLDALHYYLVEKYHWLPVQVKSLSDNDLQFLFAEEMKDWTVPKELRD
jgi:hypothetical protein